MITKPMPSIRSTYFDALPGVWRQGDWALFTERGTCVVTGRSDATLNRGGVRLGTRESYAVVEETPEVKDSLVVHVEDPDAGPGELLLFVVLVEGASLDDQLRQSLSNRLRSEASPRHAPDVIRTVPAIPRTLTGKKLETPVKRLLLGEPPAKMASHDSLLDPRAFDTFVAIAAAGGAAAEPQTS